jgi:hypothetical protein
MIQEFKRAFKKFCKSAILTHEELVTVAIEIEAVINSRPLTVLPDGFMLRPSYFLGGGSIVDLPDLGNKKEIPSTLKAYNAHRRMINGLWRALRKIYLANLQGRFAQPGQDNRYAVGDLVLIIDDQHKRHEWRTGKIIAQLPSTDGFCRNYKVEVGNKQFIRSTQRLAPLEADRVGADVVTRPPAGAVEAKSRV